MNFTQLLRSFFTPEACAHLGRAAGLDSLAAPQALAETLPLLLEALADQAGTPSGAHVAGAIASLPAFESVAAALNEPGSAVNLREAGTLLAPALLGDRMNHLTADVAQQAGVTPPVAADLLHLTLPLLLSLLGRRGVTTDNVGAVLEELRGLTLPPTATETAVMVPGLDAAPTPELLPWLRSRFSGPDAALIGLASGFPASQASRATEAAVPVLLRAMVQHARMAGGAQELLSSSHTFQDLTGDDSRVNLAFIRDPAEAARIEGQGRGLLGTLFSSLEAVTGRLGSALGTSGANAGRLLAVVAPLLLGALGTRARAAHLSAEGFRDLLGTLDGHLGALLPARLGDLLALLKAPGGPVAAVPTPAAPPVDPEAMDWEAVLPGEVPEPVPTARPARRGAFLWALIPVLLLLLGGYWWVNRQAPSAPVVNSAAPAPGLTVAAPPAGATLPARSFPMSGTGPAGIALTVQDESGEVGATTVSENSTWTLEVPSPSAGTHTYIVSAGEDRAALTVTIAGEAGSASDDGAAPEERAVGAPADTGEPFTGVTDSSAPAAAGGPTNTGVPQADALGTGPITAVFTVAAPTSGASLPAGGFTLRGSGPVGQTAELFEDDTSLGRLSVGADGLWTFNVPSPAAGRHTYRIRDAAGTGMGQVQLKVSASGARTANCTEPYTLSITNGQTVSEPFRFGGAGEGQGYTVTVRRGTRVVGTRDVPLDSTCGWSYQSRPGPGAITYEVRPLGGRAATPLSTVNLRVSD
ncbi:DUF937 domain-containing protein [Deinococcus taeanensis]|uniref:DUF937 domain-containing protein n=1 Tax=Deinococcus taeanensis TaxID=2737050 RepID=UPI001CDCC3FB|nr:DUF937 domain-containing protein [Deinococcus taeanensis]UBV42699.1 DUF937 domain-containing protein [Deinococcus taeanensis]